jgi:hypothetical protein
MSLDIGVKTSIGWVCISSIMVGIATNAAFIIYEMFQSVRKYLKDRQKHRRKEQGLDNSDENEEICEGKKKENKTQKGKQWGNPQV